MSTDRRMPDTLTGQLRWHIKHSGVSTYRIEQDTGVYSASLSRFLRGERGLSLEHIDTLGKYLGLRVVRATD